MSLFQSLVYQSLRFWFLKTRILVNHRPAWLLGLELDFFFPDLMLAIEVQGLQHKRRVPKFHKTIRDFQLQVARDSLKLNLCKKQKVYLVRIHDFGTMRCKLEGVLNRTLPSLPWYLLEKQKTHHDKLLEFKRNLKPNKQRRFKRRACDPF